MLIGHYAPALVLARVRPTVKLWQLFAATQFVDILWGICILAGIEHVRIVPGFTASNDLDLWDMPYTHSLVATLVWSAFAFVVWRSTHREKTRTGDAVVIALAVASHFVADLLVHAHDLPLMAAQGTKVGFGLWNHRFVALLVETAIFAGAALYWWLPRRTGGLGLIALTIVAAASYFIPTPRTPAAMAITGLVTYAATIALAAWIDKSRATI